MRNQGHAAIAQHFDRHRQGALRPAIFREQLDEPEIGAPLECKRELGPPSRAESELHRRPRHPPHPPQPPPPPPPPHEPPPESDDPDERLTKPSCIHASSLLA